MKTLFSFIGKPLMYCMLQKHTIGIHTHTQHTHIQKQTKTRYQSHWLWIQTLHTENAIHIQKYKCWSNKIYKVA